MFIGPATTVLLVAIVLLVSGVKILREYERGVVFRVGASLTASRGPGIIYVIPLIEQMYRLDLRTVTLDVPSQDVITRDNVSIKVNAVLYFRVVDPNRATVEVAELSLCDLADRADDTAQRLRTGAPRRAAGGARQVQCAAAGDHRYAHRYRLSFGRPEPSV